MAIFFVCFLSAMLSAFFMHIRFSQNRYLTGKEIPPEKRSQVKQRYILTPLFLLGFGIYMGFFWKAPEVKEDPDAYKTKDNKTTAYTMMQGFVNEYLKSPGSAKFEWISEPDCKIERNETIYVITSWVDSQNSFGALVRTKFNGMVEQIDNNNWKLRYLNLGSERTFIDWNWAKANGYFEMQESDFTYRFKKFVAYYIADSAVNSLDINTDRTQTVIKTSGFGEYMIVLNHASDYIIDNIVFLYRYNGTNYQDNISNKLFISVVSTIEQFYTEDEVIDLTRRIYRLKDNEQMTSLAGNNYSKNINGDNYSYTILLK
jgi:hypothetical protein